MNTTQAATENQRFAELARSLDPQDWSKQTDCPAWDVRAMVAHVLGMMELTCSVREFVHVIRAGGKAAGDRPTIDGMTEVPVAERVELTREQLLDRLAAAAPRGARSRGRLPWPLRRMPMPAEVDGVIVADVVAEWVRRHGLPYKLTLLGPAGGTFEGGAGGQEIVMDAVEFCRILSGRGSGHGLLTQAVPF